MKNMVKLWGIIAIAAIIGFTFTACDNDTTNSNQPNPPGGNIAVTSVSLCTASATFSVGGTVRLTAKVIPTNATNRAVTWSSSDNAVATVSDGVVTGVSAGTATITVTTVDGNRIASSVITVNPRQGGGIAVTSVSLSPAIATISVGGTQRLIATINPTNADWSFVGWSSSNDAVATVHNDLVTGVSAGTATITLTISTVDGNRTASSFVTVNTAPTLPALPAPTNFHVCWSIGDLIWGLPLGTTSNRIRIRWNTVTGATGYRIERATAATGPWNNISNLHGNSISLFDDIGLSSNTTMFYRIIAINNVGESVPSAAISGTTRPLTPTGVTARRINQQPRSDVQITWNAVQGAAHYKVQVLVSNFWMYVPGGQRVSGTSLRATPSSSWNLVSNTFRVIAVNGAGIESLPSSLVNCW